MEHEADEIASGSTAYADYALLDVAPVPAPVPFSFSLSVTRSMVESVARDLINSSRFIEPCVSFF